jgi:Methyltransferase FkbM domain
MPDVIKLDTQGSELDILKGAVKSLQGTSFIDIEVEFNPIYKSQPLFSEVDMFLRAHGFVLWRLPYIVHYTQEHVSSLQQDIQVTSDPEGRPKIINPGNGQIYWAQAHYVRSDLLPTTDGAAPMDSMNAMICAVVAGTYGYWDLSVMILSKHPTTIIHASYLHELLKRKDHLL